MYEDVVVEHLPQTHQSKAQSALHKSATQLCADQSATTQASRQSWRTRACRRAFTQLAAFSKRTKKSKSAWLKYTTTHNAAAQAGVTGKELAFISNIKKIQNYFVSPSLLSISYMHAASWLFSWSMELCQPSGAGTISWKVSVVATTRVSRSLLTAFRILIRISKICFSIFFPDFLC